MPVVELDVGAVGHRERHLLARAAAHVRRRRASAARLGAAAPPGGGRVAGRERLGARLVDAVADPVVVV